MGTERAPGPMKRTVARRSLQAALAAWAYRQRRAIAITLAYVRRNLTASLLTVCVIGIALALPAGLLVAVNDLKTLAGTLGTTPQATLFLKDEVTREQAERVVGELRGRPEVISARLIDRDEALAEFKASAGIGDVLSELATNPLPHAILLQFKPEPAKEGSEAAFLAHLAGLTEVAETQYDAMWIKRLRAFSGVIERATLLLAITLGLGVILIVGNATRVGIHSRHDEIEVALLCGATNSFVRRPFLYSGLLHGGCSGIAAALLVALNFKLLAGSLAELSAVYGGQFVLRGLGPAQDLVLIATGALLGLIGAWLAVTLHLKDLGSYRES